MGGAGSRVANAGRFAAEEAYWRGAKVANIRKGRSHTERLTNYAGNKRNAYYALQAPGLSGKARNRDKARQIQANAAAALWKSRREQIGRVRNRVTGAVGAGAMAAAGAVGAGVEVLREGLGKAKTYLGERASKAYAAGTRKATEAYQALRKLSPKRKATNFFLGKKGNNNIRRGGVAGKVVNLTRKARAGFDAAKQAAGQAMTKAKNAAVAVRNAATRKASNVYAYGRNMIKYGRRRTNVERLESQRRRAGAAAEAAVGAIAAGKARNANVAAAKAAKAAKAEEDAKVNKLKRGLDAAAAGMKVAAKAEAAGNEVKAASAVTTGLTKLRNGLAAVGGPIAAAATSVIGSIRVAFTRKNSKNGSKNGAKNTPTAANASNARTLNAAASQLGNAANAVATIPAAIRSNNPSAVQSRISAVKERVASALSSVAQSARVGSQRVRNGLKKFGNAAMNQAYGLAAGVKGFSNARTRAISTRRAKRMPLPLSPSGSPKPLNAVAEANEAKN